MWLLFLLPFLWLEMCIQWGCLLRLPENGISGRKLQICGLVCGLAFGSMIVLSCTMTGALATMILGH